MSDENNDIEIEMEEDIVEENGMGDKLKKLREKLKKTETEVKENMDGWQRSRADYVNLQKSFDTERSDIRKRAQTDLILELLPNLDNFDAAMANTEVWEKVDKNWRMGIEYIAQQFHKTLEDYGVAEIESKDTFDPALHDPLEIEETDDEKKDNQIIKVMQKGYTCNGKVIRPAKVKMYQYKK
jgi:molecular chaperone GrpE